jgi:DNA-binding NarL/FixJ family response regulator
MLTNVVVAVRHPIMSRGISCVLRESSQLNVVAEVNDLCTLQDICSEMKPRLVLLDSVLITLQHKVRMKELVSKFPLTRFTLVWLYETPNCAQRELSQFNIELDWKDIGGLRSAAQELLLLTAQPEFYTWHSREQEKLTARENEVLHQIARGFTTAEIATRLSISSRTAELHRYRICRKLGVSAPLDLAKLLIRQGLVPL